MAKRPWRGSLKTTTIEYKEADLDEKNTDYRR